MGVAEILTQIDAEIAQLKEARSLLAGAGSAKPKKGARPVEKRRKKRKLTPEGRKRIREAVKRRWARQKSAAAAK